MMEDVIKDVASIVNGDFAISLSLTPPIGNSFMVKGLACRITANIVTETSHSNVPFSHFTIMEKDLVEAGYNERTNGVITLKGWKIHCSDAVEQREYEIIETMPDSTLGAISIIVKDVKD